MESSKLDTNTVGIGSVKAFDPNAVSFLKSFVSQTYTGLTMDLTNPRPEDMSIIDAAHHLARITRYGGAIKTDCYSVAEHSYLMAKYIIDNAQELLAVELAHGERLDLDVVWMMAYEALMHDVGETWYGDIRAPLKKMFPEFKRFCVKTDNVAADKWGYSREKPAPVEQLDKRIVADEKAALLNPLANGNAWVQEKTPPLGVTIYGWYPRVAEAKWLEMYHALATRLFPERFTNTGELADD